MAQILRMFLFCYFNLEKDIGISEKAGFMEEEQISSENFICGLTGHPQPPRPHTSQPPGWAAVRGGPGQQRPQKPGPISLRPPGHPAEEKSPCPHCPQSPGEMGFWTFLFLLFYQGI